MLLGGIVLIVLSCVFWTLMLLRLTRANPTARVPYWGRPLHDPGKPFLLIVLTLLTLSLGSQLGARSVGLPEGLLLMVPVLVCPFVVVAWHNARVPAG